MPESVYKEDVEEIVYSLQGDIADIKEKKDKYIEKADTEIVLKSRYANVLKEIAKDLPEKRPYLPGMMPIEEVVQDTTDARNIVDIHKQ